VPVRRFIRYLRNAQWDRQHGWRHAIWKSMSSLGLGGLHVLPIRHSWLEVCERPMPFANLHPAFEGYRLVQISDLHFSPVVRGGYLRQAIAHINALQPDLLVVTGDLMTGGRRYAPRVAELLKGSQAKDGVVCTLGNHDYTMHGKRRPLRGKRAADLLEAALEREGLVVLRNEQHVISKRDGRLVLVGLDDEWTGAMDADVAFENVDEKHPIICLNHNPVNAMELIDYPWQWMLAGHTHGRPLRELRIGKRKLRRGRPFVKGYYAIAGRHLYVNGGLSYGNRRRQSNRPEITLFTLTSDGASCAMAAT
jgi:uncharacterized protein